MQGIINATGVAATVPMSELNLSSEVANAMQHTIATAIIIVLCKLIIQYFYLDSLIFLKK